MAHVAGWAGSTAGMRLLMPEWHTELEEIMEALAEEPANEADA